MFGDGINDVPAMKKSDLGVSVLNGLQCVRDSGDLLID